MVISRDERVLRLAGSGTSRCADVLGIWKRMIGTGLIGGKSVGMLLARAILKQAGPALERPAGGARLVLHRLGRLLLLPGARTAAGGCGRSSAIRSELPRRRRGGPPADPRGQLSRATSSTQFAEMLDYFGQSPIIVRSSSLLEDNFGNAFAGKYESVFCANQGPHQKRLEDFLSAVRTIYASTMSEKALRYRAQRGLLDRDEQMSLLVQRVSGALHGTLFYPQVAGVGLSFNPYVWSEYIDPEAGVLRLVFGLGTRAVDRSDDDYTRVVALNAPRAPAGGRLRRGPAVLAAARRRDRPGGEPACVSCTVRRGRPSAARACRIDIVASPAGRRRRARGNHGANESSAWVLTFDQLLSRDAVRRATCAQMLPTLAGGLRLSGGRRVHGQLLRRRTSYKINLVQCRPLQVKGGGTAGRRAARVIAADDLRSRSPRGGDRPEPGRPDRPAGLRACRRVYGQLPIRDRYAVARLIGRLMHLERAAGRRTADAHRAGPLGHHHASLGVPVSFAEIDTVVGALRDRRHARRPGARRLAGHALLQRPGGDGHPLPGAVSRTREGNCLEPRVLRATRQPAGGTAPGRRPLVRRGPGDRHARGCDGRACTCTPTVSPSGRCVTWRRRHRSEARRVGLTRPPAARRRAGFHTSRSTRMRSRRCGAGRQTGGVAPSCSPERMIPSRQNGSDAPHDSSSVRTSGLRRGPLTPRSDPAGVPCTRRGNARSGPSGT